MIRSVIKHLLCSHYEAEDSRPGKSQCLPSRNPVWRGRYTQPCLQSKVVGLVRMICTKITGAQKRVRYKIAGWGHQGRFLEEGKGDPYSGRVIDACRRKAGGGIESAGAYLREGTARKMAHKEEKQVTRESYHRLLLLGCGLKSGSGKTWGWSHQWGPDREACKPWQGFGLHHGHQWRGLARF